MHLQGCEIDAHHAACLRQEIDGSCCRRLLLQRRASWHGEQAQLRCGQAGQQGRGEAGVLAQTAGDSRATLQQWKWEQGVGAQAAASVGVFKGPLLLLLLAAVIPSGSLPSCRNPLLFRFHDTSQACPATVTRGLAGNQAGRVPRTTDTSAPPCKALRGVLRSERERDR